MAHRLRPAVVRATLAALAVAIAAPIAVHADDTVTQLVTAGTRSASVADVALANVAYAHTERTNTGAMTLTVDDSTGSNLGWNVTIQVSDFAYSGTSLGSDIPAANFALTSVGSITATAGQAVDAAGGPAVPVVSPVGTLDTPRKVIQALPTYGKGTYTESLGVSLTIPGGAAQGTYTGTLTTTISAAP